MPSPGLTEDEVEEEDRAAADVHPAAEEEEEGGEGEQASPGEPAAEYVLPVHMAIPFAGHVWPQSQRCLSWPRMAIHAFAAAHAA